jgi:hypothetical protein
MKTHVVIVIDRSGPPNGLVQASFGVVNTFINSLRENKDILSVTVNQFDDEFDQLCSQVAPSEVPELILGEAFIPGKIAQIYDAIGNSITEMGAKKNVWMCVIGNNRDDYSKEFDHDVVKEMITNKINVGWRFEFVSSNLLMVTESMDLGFNVGVAPNERHFAQTRHGFSRLNTMCADGLDVYMTQSVADYDPTSFIEEYDIVGDIVNAVIDDIPLDK